MLCSLAVSSDSLGIVSRDAATICVRKTKIELGDSVSLLCSLAVPHSGLSIISRYTLTVSVHPTEIGLCTGITLLCRLPVCLRPDPHSASTVHQISSRGIDNKGHVGTSTALQVTILPAVK